MFRTDHEAMLGENAKKKEIYLLAWKYNDAANVVK